MAVTSQDLHPRKRPRLRSGRFARTAQPPDSALEHQPSPVEMETGFVLPSLPNIPTHRIVAAAIWLIGCIPTLFAVRDVIPALSLNWAITITLIVQAGLTMLESPIWRKVVYVAGEFVERQRSWINGVALALDVVINLGSVVPVAQRLHRLDGVQAIAAMLGTPVTAITGVVLLVLSFVLATMLAAVPEKLWYRA